MKEELTNLIKEVHSNNGKIPEHLIDNMFRIHNDIFPNNLEFNKGCGTCRKRTFNRLQTYYNTNME